MNGHQKREVREAYAVKKIQEPVILDSKLLRKQIDSLSSLTRVVNDDIGDDIVGAVQILEMFEWLPKGEYVVQIKIINRR